MDFVVLVAAHGSSALNRDLLHLIPSLYPLIERLQNTRIHRRDHVHCGIKLFLGHPRFPCVRKAPLHSQIAQ
jgi:hypothetical protein